MIIQKDPHISNKEAINFAIEKKSVSSNQLGCVDSPHKKFVRTHQEPVVWSESGLLV